MNQLKLFKPITNALRHKITPIQTVNRLTNSKLSIIKKSTGGRNFFGKITCRHKGGGHKQRIKLLDNKGIMGAYSISKIIDIIYDPNRSNHLVLCKTLLNKQFLRLKAEGQTIGDKIYGKYYPLEKELLSGNIVPLKLVPIGTKIYNIELKPNQGTKLAKAAGVFAIVIKQTLINTTIKLKNKKLLILSSNCLCTIGVNGNILHNNKILGKAGANRWRGIRPTVRGEAMNPVDHPHGGETSGGVILKTVYGKLAKFVKLHK